MWQPSWSCPTEGYFYPPTLFTDVAPSATIAQVEIFGPVVVMMSFRTPAEAVELANNTRYGLAASVWSESVNLTLDVAPRLKAGTVWVNCTNVFDAAAGFGGYRESGFGREGGREGMLEYLAEPALAAAPAYAPARAPRRKPSPAGGIDRTAKLYIGGVQARPDSGYSLPVLDAGGAVAGEVGQGNRKDIRNAVEAAHAASGWGRATAHARAQVLYYLAENLGARRAEFAARIGRLTGRTARQAATEVEAALRRIFSYAAWADKWDGRVHHTPYRNVTLAMPEPLGAMAVVAPEEWPLLGFLSAVIPPVAMGNTVVAVPSARWPLLATDLYQVLDTSDLPKGVLNIVTGPREELAAVLAAHDAVDAMWYWGTRDGAAAVERLSAGNLKQTWVHHRPVRWDEVTDGEGERYLRHATQVKNVWVPYGE